MKIYYQQPVTSPIKFSKYFSVSVPLLKVSEFMRWHLHFSLTFSPSVQTPLVYLFSWLASSSDLLALVSVMYMFYVHALRKFLILSSTNLIVCYILLWSFSVFFFFFLPPINGVVFYVPDEWNFCLSLIACFCFCRKISTWYTLLEGEFWVWTFVIVFKICWNLWSFDQELNFGLILMVCGLDYSRIRPLKKAVMLLFVKR